MVVDSEKYLKLFMVYWWRWSEMHYNTRSEASLGEHYFEKKKTKTRKQTNKQTHNVGSM